MMGNSCSDTLAPRFCMLSMTAAHPSRVSLTDAARRAS